MVGRLMLAVLCMVAGDPDRRSAGSLQPDGAGPQPGDDLHRPLRPARPDRGQPGDAARGAAAHRALRQRLPVQLQPVQHRARQPAGERAAAVAGRRLHLRVRSVARRVPAHDAELRPDPDRSRRDDWRRARVDGLRASAVHVRLGGGHRPPAACPRSSRTTTRNCSAAARTWSRRATRSRRTSTSPRRSSRLASPTTSTCRWRCRLSTTDLKIVSDARIQRLGTTNELTHFFRQSDGERRRSSGCSPRSAAPAGWAT